jgi:cation diffusion facilitator family transporter
MSESCCTDKASALAQLRERQAATLRIVLVVSVVMFGVEFVSGWLAGSVALLADSLDMLGDALVYGFSLYVVARGARWKARAALSKAVVMALFGVLVLGQVVYKLAFPQAPVVQAMGAVGALALAANAFCFVLLLRHRAEDINMRSVWLCSRNDLAANVLVLAAAAAVWALGTPWPDVAAGAIICAMFLRSAWIVAREARTELQSSRVNIELSIAHEATRSR